MTCIAGLVHDGAVYIGGDSAGVSGWSLTVRADAKVFKNGDFLFGFTSSFRMGDLLRFALSPPRRHPDSDVRRFMVVDFVDAVRSCLKNGGYATTKDGGEAGGNFLVGYAGRLFEICSDYQVGEPAGGYAAVGCGEDIARGALFSNAHLLPQERITQALKAAEAHSAGVRGPFHIESIGGQS